MHSLRRRSLSISQKTKEDDAPCGMKKTISQKRQTFRPAIMKSKNLAVRRKIRHKRPKMAENLPTYVPVLRYNIDVIRWMPQRFLCTVNCIHSKETFSQTKRQFSDHQQIAWWLELKSNFKQVNFADMNLENKTFRVTGTLTHGRSEYAAARRWRKPERSTQRMNLPGEAGTRWSSLE